MEEILRAYRYLHVYFIFSCFIFSDAFCGYLGMDPVSSKHGLKLTCEITLNYIAVELARRNSSDIGSGGREWWQGVMFSFGSSCLALFQLFL